VKLHDLGPDQGAHKKRRRVARGNAGRGGTYAGRGRKGQNARPGGSKAAYFEGGQLPFVRRLPFKRGFKPIGRVTLAAVNIESLEALFAPGAEVTPDALVAAGILRSADEPYKVLGQGDLTKRLAVHAPHFSASARAAIEQAGGACHALEAAPRLILRRRHTRWPRPHRVG
jgi:large subunit ribosomal protein L15